MLRLEDHGGGLRRLLAGEREGVGLVELAAAQSRQQPVLVTGPGGDAGDEAFPDPRDSACGRGVALAVPIVEVPDDGDAFGIRRPYGEEDPGDAIERHRVGA